MGDNALAFEGTVRPEHFAEFSKVVQKTVIRPPPTFSNWLIVAIPSFLVTLGMLQWIDAVALPIDPSATIGPGEVVLVALFAGFFGGWIVLYLLAWRQQKAMASKGLREGGSFLGRRSYTLDDSGITARGDNGVWLVHWSAFTAVTEAPNTYLLWTDPVAAVMIPRDVFADEASRERFLALVRARLGEGRHAPPPDQT